LRVQFVGFVGPHHLICWLRFFFALRLKQRIMPPMDARYATSPEAKYVAVKRTINEVQFGDAFC
jgi:hypothetical protein